ncbi:hypothetical protein E2562_031175 [Oryza meyeriana var. granulata]|uniref:PB1 domain-containing protein n=1 Tax=Oryza meyeriana var. granulata TaxID=110450 RepID=A0A6G1ECV9_9ORYZ|nr:hypothetical protein E2562_031175 [Oryza meyeriana var. granulata]
MATAGEYGTSVRMIVSYGGEIVQGDHGPDGKAAAAYYAGGVHRIVKVALSERLSDLRARMAALAGFAYVSIRYALPGEGLSRLRDVADDGDLWGLVSLLFCYHEVSKPGRIRVFLFGVDAPPKTPVAPLQSASSPSLPTLVVERDTTAASGGACVAPVTQGMPRSASSPSLATSSAACDGTAVRMKVSYGGEILQRDGSAALYYAGGVNRIVRVGLSERLADVRTRLAALAGCSEVRIRYALPGEGVGHLRDVASDSDLWSLVSLLFFHEAVTNSKPNQGRIRVFLFGVGSTATSAPAAPLGHSASSPSLATSSSEDDVVHGAKHHGALPTIVEEEGEDLDTASTTPAAGGASPISPVAHGMRRSASTPALAMASTSGSDTAAPTAATSSAAVALQLGPVVWVPVMAPATVVIPVHPVVRVVDCNSSTLSRSENDLC